MMETTCKVMVLKGQGIEESNLPEDAPKVLEMKTMDMHRDHTAYVTMSIGGLNFSVHLSDLAAAVQSFEATHKLNSQDKHFTADIDLCSSDGLNLSGDLQIMKAKD